ncbi:MAG TPA: hypothetical protein V6D22_15095 [Candidatus Obscuribacterales bacterium]
MNIAIPVRFVDAAPQLVPILRNRWDVEASNLRIEILSLRQPEHINWQESCIPSKPVADELALVLCYDLPNARLFINYSHLKSWGVDFETAFSVARSNLESRQPAPFTEVAERGYVNQNADATLAARLLTPGTIAALRLQGTPVFAYLDSEHFYVTDLRSMDGLERMFGWMDQALENADNPAFLTPFVIDGASVRPLRANDIPEKLAKAKMRWRQLQLKFAKQRYDEQQKILGYLFDLRGWDYSVADTTLIARGNVDLLGCHLTPGKNVLLPKTETVFVDGFLSLPFAMLLECFGHKLSLMEDSYPPRYLVTEQLSGADIDYLRRRFLGGTSSAA